MALGCATSTVEVYDRGGLTRLFFIDRTNLVRYDRVRDDMSEATVWIPSNADCCGLLADMEPGRHELVIRRDGQRVWEGPVVRIAYGFDQVELTARDVMFYAYRTINRAGQNNAAPNSDWVTERARTIINRELSRKESLDPPINVLRYLDVRTTPTTARTTRVTKPYQKTVFEEIDDMAAKSGLDYTAIGRAIVMSDTHEPLGLTPAIGQGDFLGELVITSYGMDLATYSAVTNSEDILGGLGRRGPVLRRDRDSCYRLRGGGRRPQSDTQPAGADKPGTAQPGWALSGAGRGQGAGCLGAQPVLPGDLVRRPGARREDAAEREVWVSLGQPGAEAGQGARGAGRERRADHGHPGPLARKRARHRGVVGGYRMSTMTPRDFDEWARATNRRLSAIERHRHPTTDGGGGSGEPGPPGPEGEGFLSGSGPPPAGFGAIGDSYLDVDTGDTYGPKTASGWGAPTGSLIGPEGDPGAPGPTGFTGPAGATGPQGPPGTSGTGVDEVTVAHQPAPTTSGLELWVDLDTDVPAAGTGIPPGGLAGQVLSKDTNVDYAATWQNSPKGLLALAERTTDFTGTQTTPNDVPGLSITFTVPAGRKIKVTATTQLQKNGGDTATWCGTQVVDGGNGLKHEADIYLTAPGWRHVSNAYVFTSTATTYTFKVQLWTGGGYVNVLGVNGSAQIWAEDIGAS